MKKKAENFLPLSHTTFYILISLSEPMHGTEIMDCVEKMSDGEVTLGPGTLYGTLTKLDKEGLIEKHGGADSDRRKNYALTELGRLVVTLEYKRIQKLVGKCGVYIDELQKTAKTV